MKALAVIAFLALFAIASAQFITPLKTGRYQSFSVEKDGYAYFSVPVVEDKKGSLDVEINPTRCNGGVTMYASFKSKFPSSSDYDYKASGAAQQVVQINVPEQEVVAPQKQLYVAVKFDTLSSVTAPCAGYIVAIVNHYLNMVHIVEGIPSIGYFNDTEEVAHFYEFYANQTTSESQGFLGVIVSGTDNSNLPELNIYVATKTSRPLPSSAQWTGLMTSNGAFAAILHQDPAYISESRYYVGVATNTNIRPIPYTLTFFQHSLSVSSQQQPILLQNKQSQVGFSLTGSYSYFVIYVDAETSYILLTLHQSVGASTMYVSSKTNQPTKSNYEHRSSGDLQINVGTPQFLYVGVYGEDSSPGVAAFTLLYVREDIDLFRK